MTKTRGMVSMKILALNGSARKRGNTDILIDQILKGVKKRDIRARSFTYTIMKSCLAGIAGIARREIMFAP